LADNQTLNAENKHTTTKTGKNVAKRRFSVRPTDEIQASALLEMGVIRRDADVVSATSGVIARVPHFVSQSGSASCAGHNLDVTRVGCCIDADVRLAVSVASVVAPRIWTHKQKLKDAEAGGTR
jgi:hypothetical protein